MRSVEQLHACPRCGRSNFTAAGLARHRCSPFAAPVLSAMPKPSPAKTSALAVLHDKQISTAVDISKLQGMALSQLKLIDRMHRDAALHAIITGILLHVIKDGIGHGNFKPWLNKHADVGYQQCNYYMRLGTEFVGHMKVSAAELKELPTTQEGLLAINDGAANKVYSKAVKFVGKLSLNELLAKHGIKDSKKIGGAREAGDGEDAPIDPEKLSAMKRDEASDYLARARQLFVDENIFQHFKPDETRAVVEGLEALIIEVKAAVKPLLKKS